MAKDALSFDQRTVPKRAALPQSFDEFTYVKLRRPVVSGAVTYAAGTRGVVVHKHADGVGYEVEFEQPKFGVITLTYKDLRPDHG